MCLRGFTNSFTTFTNKVYLYLVLVFISRHLKLNNVFFKNITIQTFNLFPTVPCCPENTTISLESWETLKIEWSPVRGADLYQTRAVDASEVILCNDTAPVCALSDLTCNTRYSVVVIPCNDIRGCNLTCRPQTHETGISTLTRLLRHKYIMFLYQDTLLSLSLYFS